MPIYSLDRRRVELRGARHYIAPGAALVGSIVLENEVSVWFGVAIRADNDRVHIGEGTNIQDGSVLHVDPGFPLTIGRNVTVGHRAMLHGCTVGDGVLVGIGAIVLNGARIGAGSLVGAGALVLEGKEIPPGVLALGSPARVVRELKPREREGILAISRSYVERAKLFAAKLKERR
jgi:carbonic anhydrase/acetyltransferase-like protein (isoleucine patch superfamily)